MCVYMSVRMCVCVPRAIMCMCTSVQRGRRAGAMAGGAVAGQALCSVCVCGCMYVCICMCHGHICESGMI